MHRTAEYGIAAHWKYKEASNNGGAAVPMTVTEEEKLSWLRQILEWQRDMSDNKEFMSLLKSDLDLFSDTVFCFTPTGDVKNLPNGSTPIDFAYSIHSAVGNKMIGAKANGKLVPIDYVIQNGDRIEIITSQNSKGPSRDWLNIVICTGLVQFCKRPAAAGRLAGRCLAGGAGGRGRRRRLCRLAQKAEKVRAASPSCTKFKIFGKRG